MSNTKLPPDANLSAAAAIANKWLAAGGMVGKPQVLPPWEEMRWFEEPKTTLVTNSGSGVIQLVETNPRRVAMLVGASGTVYIAPSQSINPAGGEGLLIQPGQGPIYITQKAHGNLCQVQWFVSQVFGTVVVTVIEVILRDWPRSNK